MSSTLPILSELPVSADSGDLLWPLAHRLCGSVSCAAHLCTQLDLCAFITSLEPIQVCLWLLLLPASAGSQVLPSSHSLTPWAFWASPRCVSPMCWWIRLGSLTPYLLPPPLGIFSPPPALQPLPLTHPMELSVLLDITTPIRHPAPARSHWHFGMRSASSTIRAGLWGFWCPHCLIEPLALAPQVCLNHSYHLGSELPPPFHRAKFLSLGQLIVPISFFL